MEELKASIIQIQLPTRQKSELKIFQNVISIPLKHLKVITLPIDY